MRILMILEAKFPPDRRVENEALSLIKGGHSVFLLCYSEREDHNENYKGINLLKRRINYFTRKSSVGALKIPVYFNHWKREIFKAISALQADIVHLHDLPLIKPVFELQKQFGYKIVLDLHENWPGLLNISPHTKTVMGRLLCSIRQWRKYELEYIGKVDAIIVVIDESKERLNRISGQNLNIQLVSNTINTDNIEDFDKPNRINSDKTVFIYEGGVTYHRGLQFVLAAMNMMPASVLNKIELWVIGAGSYLEKLKKQAARGNLKNVKFFGWQPQEKVYDMLSRADIALIPHIKSEHTDSTIPHKLFHYIYSEIPILSSDCVPLTRIINETSSGITYSYDDIDDLSLKMTALSEDPIKRENYRGGKASIAKKYNWKFDEQRLLDLYSTL